MSYIFLKKAFDESEKYFAIDENKIEMLYLHDTYDKYGEQIGHEAASDYCLENSQCTAKQDCEAAIQEKFGLNGVLIDDDHIYSFDGIQADDFHGNFIDEPSDWADEYNATLQKIIDINDFIDEWRAQNEYFTAVNGFNYWNGHNWQTVIVYSPDGAPSHEVIDDENLTDELNEAIENKSFVSEGFGVKVYEWGDWNIEDSYCEGTWASYILARKEN